MPLPKPRSGEKQNDWTDRCMSDPAMVDEFPDADQRYALCMDAWRDRGAAAAAAGGGGAMYLQVRDALASGSLEIDRDNHELRNVSLITAGPADGHDFEIDAIMLAQVAESIGQGPGVKCRLTHPELSGGVFGNGTDGVEVMLGRARQPRVAGNKVYGTVHFGSYARKVPGKGDVEGYLMDLAAEDPDQVGLSIGFVPDKFEVSRDEEGEIVKTLGRIKRIVAVDFVGSPAANPAGLLSATQNAQNQPGGPGPARAPQRSGGIPMNPKLLEYLTSIGLKADATEAEAVAFWNTRQGDEKLKADALAAGREPPAAKQSQPPVARQGGKQGDEAAGKQGDPPAMLSAEQAEAVQLLAREAERKRFREVTALAGRLNLGADWASEQVLSDRTLEQIKDLALDKVAEARKPVAGGGYVEPGVDRNLSTLGPAISDAILLRAGAPMVEFDPDTRRALRDDQGRLQTREPHERARSFRSLSMVEIGRAWLTQVGVPDVGQLGRTRVAELILSPGRLRRSYGHVVALAQSTSDFPYILEDAIGRRLRAGYEEAEKTWPAWVRRTTHPDFKDIKPVALSESPDLATRPEGGEIKYVTLSETRETYALVEYAGGIRVTRRMIVNDDLGAFDRIPQLQSAAAARKEDDVVYSILTTNA
ncbi:MAG TPA: hypothetical protein VMW52_06275, partial [Phycisphaerae bacterium]|nr:hypothetical protein [Phycisphaerae bacterium]